MIDTAPWLICDYCGRPPLTDSCTCTYWRNPVIRRRMEREVRARHLASVALAMSHVTIVRRAA